MDVIRERECKDTIERQLSEERKLRGKSLLKFLIISIKKTPAQIIESQFLLCREPNIHKYLLIKKNLFFVIKLTFLTLGAVNTMGTINL